MFLSNTLKKLFQDSAANVAIEFAIVAPLFFLMVLANIEFCLIVSASSMLEAAVLEAAREGSTGYIPASYGTGQAAQQAYLKNLIQTKIGSFLNPNKVVVTFPGNTDTGGAQYVTYQASYPWPVSLGYLSRIITTNGNYNITATAIVQNEHH